MKSFVYHNHNNYFGIIPSENLISAVGFIPLVLKKSYFKKLSS